jgi:hypothetical protein
MDLHGVEADEHISRANMKTLSALVKAADRILNY